MVGMDGVRVEMAHKARLGEHVSAWESTAAPSGVRTLLASLNPHIRYSASPWHPTRPCSAPKAGASGHTV
eukprot:3750567-Prymnesium_polylepis.1